MNQATFEWLVAETKAGCAVSKLLNAKISLNATLLRSLDVPANPGTVTTRESGTLPSSSSHLWRKGRVVDMIFLAGNYMTTCALLNAFSVPG
jgi:N-methylhydantoinase B/oxoprolinase/acetone carboxylase alpha subunit